MKKDTKFRETIPASVETLLTEVLMPRIMYAIADVEHARNNVPITYTVALCEPFRLGI